MENEGNRQIPQDRKTLEKSQKRPHVIIIGGAHDDGSHGLKCLMGLRPAGNPNPVMLRGAGRGTRAGRDPERHETGHGYMKYYCEGGFGNPQGLDGLEWVS